MGADMLVAAVAVKKENIDKIDIEAGKELVRNMEIDQDFVDELVNNGDLWEEEDYLKVDKDGEFTDEVDFEKVRQWLLDRVQSFGETIHSRYTTTMGVRDLYLFLTGGLSWGDAPEGCNELWVMDQIPGALEAMGFVTDYYDVEKDETVSPEEEQAAIASIQKATN